MNDKETDNDIYKDLDNCKIVKINNHDVKYIIYNYYSLKNIIMAFVI